MKSKHRRAMRGKKKEQEQQDWEEPPEWPELGLPEQEEKQETEKEAA